MWARGKARSRFPRRHIAYGAGLRRNPRAGANRHVPANAGLARENHPVPDASAAGHPDARHEQAQAADAHVVPYLHEIVDLRPVPDPRVVDAPAIDRRVRADLDVVPNNAAAHLRKLHVRALSKHVPKAIAADAHAAMQCAPRTDDTVRVHGDMRKEAALRSNRAARFDNAMRTDPRARPNLHVFADHRIRVHSHAVTQTRRWRHNRGRMHAGHHGVRLKMQGNDREQRVVRVRDHHSCRTRAGMVRKVGRHDDNAGARRGELRAVLRRCEKTHIVAFRAVERCHAAHARAGRTNHATAHRAGNARGGHLGGKTSAHAVGVRRGRPFAPATARRRPAASSP